MNQQILNLYVHALLNLLFQKINKLLACLLACLVDLFTYYNYRNKVILLKSQFLKIAKNVLLTQKYLFLIYEFKLCWHNDIDGQANILPVFCPFKAYPGLPQNYILHNSSRHLIINYCYKSLHARFLKDYLILLFPFIFRQDRIWKTLGNISLANLKSSCPSGGVLWKGLF